MSHNTRRIVLTALLCLSLPLAASAAGSSRPDRPGPESGAGRFLVLLWERVTAPFAVFLDGATSDPAALPADTLPPAPPAPPEDSTDGRSILDPIG